MDDLTRAIAKAVRDYWSAGAYVTAERVAAALAPLIEAQVREAQADAWDEGFEAGMSMDPAESMYDGTLSPAPPNPYHREVRRG